MGGMDISARLDFAAPPSEVYPMLVNQQYQEQVCVDSHSLRYEVSVTPSGAKTSRTLPAPASAARFTGPELTIMEDVRWDEPSGDGSRTGTLTMSVQGQPVTLEGNLRLGPGGRGTVIDLTGELKVAIPLIGRKLEQSAAPAVLAGYSTQQGVGDRWLQ